MQPYYVKQREYLADRHRREVERALTDCTRRVKFSTERQLDARKKLDEVTEDYVRRGFCYFSPKDYNWHRVSEHKTITPYLRRLAKDMHRPFILVNESSHHMTINMPRYKKLTPLVTPLMMVATEGPRYPRMEERVRWEKHVTTRYIFTLEGKDYDVPHPLTAWWLNEMNTNIEWRRLFNA